MARVLILSFAYYPVEVPVSFRMGSFARWLTEWGYTVRVLSPGWTQANSRSVGYFAGTVADAVPEARKHEIVNFEAAPKMFSDWTGKISMLQFFPHNRQIVKKMVAKGRQLHQEEPFDVILATAPPHISIFIAADKLSRILGVPWVADKRDIVAQFPEIQSLSLRGRAKFFITRLTRLRDRWIAAETDLCNRAFVTVTVSDALSDMLRAQGVKRTEIVLNGYEEEDFSVIAINSAKFTVQFFGLFNRLFFQITPLLDALDDLLLNGKVDPTDFEVVFWGTQTVECIAPMIQERACRKVVKVEGRIPKNEANARMKGSNVLLHLSYPKSKGLFTSKIVEYMAANKPILSIPGDGDVVDRFLKETGAGVSLGEPGAIAEYLLGHYQAWKRGEKPTNTVDPDIKEFYTRRKQAEKMARLLDEAIASNQGR